MKNSTIQIYKTALFDRFREADEDSFFNNSNIYISQKANKLSLLYFFLLSRYPENLLNVRFVEKVYVNKALNPKMI
ncbi:hypothetical protein KHM19_24470 [Leptospira borgpetersenii]|nr:hypothetical protein KHM09_25200 [Leptospira borgpetersenii]GIM23264.1 hypothetical protein KHM19_24470 [Leptospira borgpetersenii]GIM26563.1 hypothetical protein KHM25_24880 [Leptospira borgpetersenii]